MEDIYCFGGNPLDRASERRDDREWIDGLLGDPETRILALRDLKPFTRGSAAPTLDWQPVAPWRDQIDGGAALIFLGLGDGRAHFAIDATGAQIAPDVDTELIDVRALAPAMAPGRRPSLPRPAASSTGTPATASVRNAGRRPGWPRPGGCGAARIAGRRTSRAPIRS